MKIIITIITLMLISLFLNSCSSGSSTKNNTNSFNYPITPTVNVVNNYFGTLIPDPYQWLESTTSPNVLSWVNEQNNFTQKYFDMLPDYSHILGQVNAIYDNSNTTNKSLKFDKQFKTIVTGRGVYFYQINKDYDEVEHIERKTIPGMGKQLTISRDNIIYITNNPDQAGKAFINLNSFYPNDVITTTGITIFDEGKYLVISLSHNSGDLSDLLIIDIASKKQIALIPNTFGNVLAWHSGFFYVAPRDVANPLLSSYNNDDLNYFSINNHGQTQTTTVYSGDSHISVGLSYLDTTSSKLYFQTGFDVANNLYQVDLTKDIWQPEIFIDDGFLHSYNILNIINNQVLITTNSDARRLRLISVDADNPERQNWQNILPEVNSQKIINGIYNCGNKYIVDSIDDKGISKVAQYGEDGSFENDIMLPGQGAVSLYKDYCLSESHFVMSYSNLVTPWKYINYNPQTHTGNIYFTTKVATFNPEDYEMTEASIPSTDGAVINIFLAYKKGLQLNGKNPAYIYIYGGFNYPLLANFSRKEVFFLENGGVYVVAQVRGGGEQGTSWYNDARLMKKQNTYDDTIAVAKYLINHGYTNPGKLGLGGRSNGGLTAAAVALERPDLFQVAFPAVGVLDLLRYDLFTYGFSWYLDYGYSSNQNEFNNMLNFSPLQNIHTKAYPAMYIQTSQQDTRVPPLHSYKFAATMQNVASGPNPYLLDSYPNLSHFLGTMENVEAAKTWAFFFANTNTPILTK
ncbi:MAG: hypothetical protein K0R94_198 [Burkholderiales bacterium]|jgi:prolyl oligopeptidase|nr:hypothetical protein [Burkholderiales bacterium]